MHPQMAREQNCRTTRYKIFSLTKFGQRHITVDFFPFTNPAEPDNQVPSIAKRRLIQSAGALSRIALSNSEQKCQALQ